MDALGIVGKCAPRITWRPAVEQLRVLVATDIGADHQLAGSRAGVDCLDPVRRRQQQLRPAFLSHTPRLGNSAQVGDERQMLPTGVKAAGVRRTHEQKLSQIRHPPPRLARHIVV
jgi:hypothetical protein